METNTCTAKLSVDPKHQSGCHLKSLISLASHNYKTSCISNNFNALKCL